MWRALSAVANPLWAAADRMSSAVIVLVFSETPLLPSEMLLPGAANLLSAVAKLLSGVAVGLALQEVAF